MEMKRNGYLSRSSETNTGNANGPKKLRWRRKEKM